MQLDQQRARIVLIALEVVATIALKVLSGYCGRCSSADRPWLHAGGQLLRHLHIDAHLVHVGDAKQLGSVAAAGAAAGIDERADIGLARGHDAVERRDDALEVFERREPVDFALIGGDLRRGGVEPGDGAVVVGLLAFLFLHGDDALRRVAPALRRSIAANCSFGLPDFDLRLGRIELGLRRRELRVEIGRLDFGQQIALFHMRAVVEVPVLQIAADARVDRRLVPGLDGAGQRRVAGSRRRRAA